MRLPWPASACQCRCAWSDVRRRDEPVIFIFLVVPVLLDSGRLEGLANLQSPEYTFGDARSVTGYFRGIPMAVGEHLIAGSIHIPPLSLEVLSNQCSHLEHGDLILAEHLLQFFIGVD